MDQQEHLEAKRKKRREQYWKDPQRSRERGRRWREKHRDANLARRRELRALRREELREEARRHYHINRERILARRRELYRQKPRRKRTEAQKLAARRRIKAYRLRHRERLRAIEKSRIANDPGYRLARLLRSRVGKAVKLQYAEKAAKTMDVVGCSMRELLVHLENQFEPGMNWQNQGRDGWHIDHIIPCAAFDLRKPDQQRRCFHYSNLRPVWARINEKKASKIEGELPLLYRHRNPPVRAPACQPG